jgi:hypothetical protein
VPIASILINFEVTEELSFNNLIPKEMSLKIHDQDMPDIFIKKVPSVRSIIEEFKNR